MPDINGNLTPQEVAQEQMRSQAMAAGVDLANQPGMANNLDVAAPPAAQILAPTNAAGNFDPSAIDLNTPTGTTKAPATMTGQAYKPPSDLPVPEVSPAAGPDVGPQAPYLDYATAYQAAGQGGGPVMTAKNMMAARTAKDINENNRTLMRGMGGRYGELGLEQEKARDDIAFKGVMTGIEVDQMNREQAEQDKANADRQARYSEKIEAGRKEYDTAVKNFNPNRMFGNSGKRIGFAIATALGALGAAFLKQSGNSALDIINDALDRDIDAQKTGIAGKRENISLMQQQYADFRQAGMDERAARLSAKANAWEGLSKYTETRLQSVQGDEARVSGANLKDAMWMEGDKARLLTAQINAKPSGSRMSEADRVKKALELQKLSGSVRSQEVNTQAAELKAEQSKATGGEENQSALNRRAKLATQYAGADSAVKGLEDLRTFISGDRMAMAARFPNLTSSEDMEKSVRKIISDAARSRGGPTTRSDQEIEEATADIIPALMNPMTWSDGSAVRRIDALMNTYTSKRDAVLEGQNAADVYAVKSQITKRKATATDEAKRILDKRKSK